MATRKDKQNRKRVQRLHAMRRRDSRVLRVHVGDRVSLYNRHAERKEHANATLAADPARKPRPIYCRKTGLLIGHADAFECWHTEHVLNQACEDPDTQAWIWQRFDESHVHPAWLETSSERLRVLQRLMPHAYCVYARHELLGDQGHSAGNGGDSARARHDELQTLLATDTAIVIEYAELLRRANGMFQRYARRGNQPELPAHDAVEAIYNLRDWLTGAIREAQQRRHDSDVDRHKVVTLADVKQFGFELGSRTFRDARINADDDDELLVDVAEIFADASAEMQTAWIYHPPPKAAREQRYTGRTHAACACEPSAPSARSATDAPDAPVFPPITLFGSQATAPAAPAANGDTADE